MRNLLLLALAAALAGCGSSEKAEGWTSENKRLFDALEKAKGDLTKLSVQDKAACDKINPPGTQPNTAAPGASGMPQGYATPGG